MLRLPNPKMTSSSFKKQVAQHRMGNFKTKQKTNKTGKGKGITQPSRVSPPTGPCTFVIIFNLQILLRQIFLEISFKFN